MKVSAVARYRRRVKINEIGERTSDYKTIAGIFQEDVAREEKEMVKR